jgi:hypothetical protein
MCRGVNHVIFDDEGSGVEDVMGRKGQTWNWKKKMLKEIL